MAKVYTLVGDTLYNGARDGEGGIWVRVRDEDDRRILAQALDKQLKNVEASKGTMSALDPNATHLTDYIRWSLERMKDGINGARPSENQLDGTPMGEQLAAGNGDASDATAEPKRGKGKRGGKPSTVGDVLKTVAGGPLPGSPPIGGGVVEADDTGIKWADSVPVPRPAIGDTARAADGVDAAISRVIGFDGGAGAFRVVTDTSGDEQTLVYAYGPKLWRYMAQAIDYADTDSNGEQPYAADTPAETPPAPPAASTAADTNPTTQRRRNAAHAGLGKPDGKLPAAKKSAKKPAAGKKPRR